MEQDLLLALQVLFESLWQKYLLKLIKEYKNKSILINIF